jgi:hypothetical protein
MEAARAAAEHERRLQAVRDGSPAVQDGPYAYTGRDGYMGAAKEAPDATA